jgi:hypothetical protein
MAERDDAHWTQRAIMLVAVVLGAHLLFRLRGFRPDGLLELMLVAAAPVVIVHLIRRDLRETAVWAAYMIGFVAFADFRAAADDVGFPVRMDYVITLERILFFGAVPTTWLQDRLYTVGSPSLLDWFVVGVHVSYFLVPHAVAFFLWAYRREHFARYLVAVMATYYIALFFQMLFPTVPPWMAGVQGGLPTVYRMVNDVLYGLSPATFELGLRMVGANDVAAMPSLHSAITVLVALGLRCVSVHAARAGWAYALLMVFALVYMGEHYVVDAIAGGALAIVIWYATRRILMRVHESSSPGADALRTETTLPRTTVRLG